MQAETKHILIQGRVQGVFYRASLQQQAIALGLTGWCRNLPNGHVEALAHGPEGALSQLINWCHHGPPHAVVTAVVVSDAMEPVLPSGGFEIKP